MVLLIVVCVYICFVKGQRLLQYVFYNLQVALSTVNQNSGRGFVNDD